MDSLEVVKAESEDLPQRRVTDLTKLRPAHPTCKRRPVLLKALRRGHREGQGRSNGPMDTESSAFAEESMPDVPLKKNLIMKVNFTIKASGRTSWILRRIVQPPVTSVLWTVYDKRGFEDTEAFAEFLEGGVSSLPLRQASYSGGDLSLRRSTHSRNTHCLSVLCWSHCDVWSQFRTVGLRVTRWSSALVTFGAHSMRSFWRKPPTSEQPLLSIVEEEIWQIWDLSRETGPVPLYARRTKYSALIANLRSFTRGLKSSMSWAYSGVVDYTAPRTTLVRW